LQILHHRLSAGADVQLFVDSAQVGADGFDADVQRRRDFFVEVPLAK
jgi:hypothetical protein